MWLGDVRDQFLLHTAVAKRLQVALDGRPRPADEGRVIVVGPDPIRVLLVGAGLAVGYGVADRGDALDGAIGRILAAELGRGVVVDHQVRPDLPISQTTTQLLGAAGAHTYDAVVWCPTFSELPRTWRAKQWLVRLRVIMAHLLETGDPRTHYLLLGYPAIEDDGALERITAMWTNRINSRIDRITSEYARTAYIRPPAVSQVGKALDADYYRRCGTQVAASLIDLLALRGARA